MFSRALYIALFSLYLSAFTAQAAPAASGFGIQLQARHFARKEPTGSKGGEGAGAGASETSSSSTAVATPVGGANTEAKGNAANPKNDATNPPSGTSSENGSGNASTTSASEPTGTAAAALAGGNDAAASNTNVTLADTTTTSSAAVAAATTAATNSTGDPQTSLTLDPAVIATGFADNGQDVPAAGQVPSLTSTNNFINFCLTSTLPITNGQQITTGSCNPAIMGVIAATTNMPSSKFVFPPNFGTVAANTQFTIQMAISHLDTGFFVNAQENYFAAPQFTNSDGDVQGHSHVVVQLVDSLEQTTPPDPKVFAFFKGLNGKADSNGILTASVDKGLPAGVYKLSSINTAANHQPVLGAVAQHGSFDDAIYFTVTDDGAPPANTTTASGNTATDVATATGGAAQTGDAAATGTDIATGATETGAAGGSGGNGKGTVIDLGNGAATTTGEAAGTGGQATGTAIDLNNGKATETGGAAATGNPSGNGKGNAHGGGNGAGSATTAAGNANVGNQNGANGSTATVTTIAAAATGTSGNAVFGNCTIPKIEFGVGQDGKGIFNFGISASEEFSIIADFVCNILENNCEANDVAKQLCSQASSDANTVSDRTGKPADVFNGWFGQKTDFHNSPRSLSS